MTITIDLNPNEEARLTAEAKRAGMQLEELVRQLVREHLPEDPAVAAASNDPTVELLTSWLAEAPSDPELVREAEADLLDFKRGMNRNRQEAGARLPYPEAECPE